MHRQSGVQAHERRGIHRYEHQARGLDDTIYSHLGLLSDPKISAPLFVGPGER